MKFPDNFGYRPNGLKTTLLFINKQPVDGKVEFFYYPSLYPHFVYGSWKIKTRNFFLKIQNTMEQIFGNPIINHLKIPQLNNEKSWSNGRIMYFQKYIIRNNIKLISIKDVYEQKNKFGKYHEYFVDVLSDKNINLERATFYYDFMAEMTFFQMKY